MFDNTIKKGILIERFIQVVLFYNLLDNWYIKASGPKYIINSILHSKFSFYFIDFEKLARKTGKHHNKLF